MSLLKYPVSRNGSLSHIFRYSVWKKKEKFTIQRLLCTSTPLYSVWLSLQNASQNRHILICPSQLRKVNLVADFRACLLFPLPPLQPTHQVPEKYFGAISVFQWKLPSVVEGKEKLLFYIDAYIWGLWRSDQLWCGTTTAMKRSYGNGLFRQLKSSYSFNIIHSSTD